MGMLPLQYPAAQNAESLGLTGEETFDVTGVEALNEGGTPRPHGHVTADGRRVEFDARRAHRHPR